MGFCQSKEAVDRGATATATSATNKTTATLKDFFKPANDLVQKVEALALGGQKDDKKGPAHHLRNVFAAPLGDLGGFHPPKYPKSNEEKDLLTKALRASFVFKGVSDKDFGTLVDAFEKIQVEKGAVVIKQGDTGDYFYVLKTGTVRFEVDGVAKGKAGSGDSFGELALLYSSPRAASAIAETPCEIFRVDQKTFRKIRQKDAQSGDTDKLKLLRGVEFFKDLDSRDIAKLSKVMKPRPFKEGEFLARKGEVGDCFIIIQQGKAVAKNISVGGKKYEDIALEPGGYFGEGALMKGGGERVADVVGLSPGVAMLIDKEKFEKTMGDFDGLITKATEKRQLGAIKILTDTGLDSVDLSTLAGLMTEKAFKKHEKVFERGRITDAALYLVREGSVKITQWDGKKDQIISEVGYFGEDLLTADKASKGFGDGTITPRYTVVAAENCRLGVLKLVDCRSVFDTTKIGTRLQDEAAMERKIKLKDLKKHSILGAGTFGQVWLVSHKGEDGKQRAYALKIQIKYDLIETGQAEGVVREKNVMSQLHYQFLMRLANTYQDPQRIYMLLGILQGGELRSVLYERGYTEGIPEKDAKFYSAGLVDGLSFMHSRHIIHRDLKPENVMINENGYPVIIDFGFAKYVPDKTYTFCGTPLYIAPEVLLNRGHDWGADHWSVGVMIFEMMSGRTPFYEDGMDQLTLFRAIVQGDFDFPKHGMSSSAKEIVLDFLEVEPSYRLGSLAGGLKDIYRHHWFKDLDFREIRRQAVKAPWQPEIKNPLDNSNFDDWSHLEDKEKVKSPTLTKKQQELFATF